MCIRDRFHAITGSDLLHDVLAGLEEAKRVGLAPIKLNVVVMRGVNDDEIRRLAELTNDNPLHVRFIELMPVKHWDSAEYRKRFMSVDAMMQRIPSLPSAHLGFAKDTTGPAQMYTLPKAKGRVGFIAPLSWHFCGSCNRLRTTVDGKIRSCLFSEHELDFKTALRKGATPFELIRILRQSVEQKPRRHYLVGGARRIREADRRRGMYAIGG